MYSIEFYGSAKTCWKTTSSSSPTSGRLVLIENAATTNTRNTIFHLLVLPLNVQKHLSWSPSQRSIKAGWHSKAESSPMLFNSWMRRRRRFDPRAMLYRSAISNLHVEGLYVDRESTNALLAILKRPSRSTERDLPNIQILRGRWPMLPTLSAWWHWTCSPKEGADERAAPLTHGRSRLPRKPLRCWRRPENLCAARSPRRYRIRPRQLCLPSSR